MKHVIVGNGPAGMTAALTIRAARPEDAVTVVTADEGAYYSKVREPDLVAGKVDAATLELAGESAIRQAGIDLMAGVAVRSLDCGARRLFLEDGRELSYDRLLLATGASPVVPPVPGLCPPSGEAAPDTPAGTRGRGAGYPLPAGVFALRTLQDARRLAGAAGSARGAVVVGGGFIGVHVAWVLAMRGLRVTLIEKMPTLLPGACDPEASALIAGHLERSGIRVMLNTELEALESGGVDLKVRAGGGAIPCQLVVLAVGVRPNLALARQAGAAVDEGVITDGTLATTVPDLWAAGDVAQTLDLATGKQAMLPLWPLAVAQGRVAGRNMAGLRSSYRGGLRVNAVHLGPLQVISVGDVFPSGPSARVLTTSGAWGRVSAGPVPWGRFPGQPGAPGFTPVYGRIAFQDDRPVGALLVGRVEAAGILANLIARAIHLSRTEDAARLLRSVLRVALPTRL